MHDVQSQSKHGEPTQFGSKEELENIGLFLAKNLSVCKLFREHSSTLNNSKFLFFFILLFSIYAFVLLILI